MNDIFFREPYRENAEPLNPIGAVRNITRPVTRAGYSRIVVHGISCQGRRRVANEEPGE